ncbi:GAF domain-containing protein, partial [Anaerolineales bacterium HSG24]|nr:GAF domain-containing protein [Anaerolineales bacterium HSG24]
MKPLTVIQFFSQQITKNKPIEAVLIDLTAHLSQQWGIHQLALYLAQPPEPTFQPLFHAPQNQPPVLAAQLPQLLKSPTPHHTETGLLLPMWYADALWGAIGLSPEPPSSSQAVWPVLADLLSGWLGQQIKLNQQPAETTSHTVTATSQAKPALSYQYNPHRSQPLQPHINPPATDSPLSPIVLQGKTIGQIGLISQPSQWSEADQQLLDEVSQQTSQAIENARLLAETSARTQETESLFQVSRALVEANTLDEIYQLVIETVKATDIDRVSISLLDRNQEGQIETTWIAATWDRDPSKQSPVGTRFSAKNFGLVHTFARPPFHPLISEDLSNPVQPDPRLDEAFRLFVSKNLAMQTMFSVPMFLGSEYKGVMSIYTRRPHHYSQHHIRLYQLLADQAIISVENHILLAQMERALHETEALYQTSRAFNTVQDPVALLQTLVRYLRSAGSPDGSASDDSTSDGSTSDGSTSDGSTSNGSTGSSDGSASDGSTSNGSAGSPDGLVADEIDLVALSRWNRRLKSGQSPTGLRWSVCWRAPDQSQTEPVDLTVGNFPFIAQLTATEPAQFESPPSPSQGWSEPFQQVQQLRYWPLNVGGNWLGGLWLGSRQADFSLSATLHQQLRTLSGQVAVVWQNLDLVARTQYNLYRTGLLSELGEALLAADRASMIYEACLAAIARTEPDQALIFITAEQAEGQPLELVGRWVNEAGESAESPTLGQQFSQASLGLLPLVADGSIEQIDSISSNEQLTNQTKQILNLMGLSAILILPLWVRRKVGGLLLVGVGSVAERGHAFEEQKVALCEDIARRASDALEYQRVFDEANYRAKLLETTAEISETATASLDLTVLLPQTVDLIRDRLDFYQVSIFLVDDYQRYAVLAASTGTVGQTMLARRHKLAVGGQSIVGTATGGGEAHIALDVGEDAVHFNNPLLPHTRSEMALPLLARGLVIGALDVQSTEAGAFTESDITILQSMANQLANAIEAARAFQESRVALEEVNKLHQHYLREAWGGFMQEQQGALQYRLDHSFISADQSNDQSADQSGDQSSGDTESLESLESLNQRIEESIASGSMVVAELDSESNHQQVVQPLMLRGQTAIGALDLVIDPTDEGWDEDNFRIIEAVASQATQALEQARLFEQTQSAREEAEALYKVVRTLVSIDEEQELYEALLEALLGALGLQCGGIIMLDEPLPIKIETKTAPDELVSDSSSSSSSSSTSSTSSTSSRNTPSPQTLTSRSVALFLNSQPIPRAITPSRKYTQLFQQLASQPEPLMIMNAPHNEWLATLQSALIKYDVRAMLVVPIIINEQLVGAVRAEVRGQSYQFGEREINLATAMVNQLAISLQNHRLLAETKRRAVQLQTSADVGRVATSILDQDDMLNQAVELIKERFGFYHVQVFLIDPLSQYAVLRHSTGELGSRLLMLKHKVAIGSSSVIGQVTDSRESLVLRLGDTEDFNNQADLRNSDSGGL